jgi:hypothetical protein
VAFVDRTVAGIVDIAPSLYWLHVIDGYWGVQASAERQIS